MDHVQPFLLQADGGGFGSIIVLILPLILIWYFLLIRPQSRERKVQEQMRRELKKGDKVLTQGGIIAKVHSVADNEIVLSLDGTARMRVARESVLRRVDESAATPGTKDRDTPAKAESESAAG